MTEPCPICFTTLTVWYDLDKEEVVATCPNPQCVLCQNNVQGRGDRIKEAVERFVGLSLKFDNAQA